MSPTNLTNNDSIILSVLSKKWQTVREIRGKCKSSIDMTHNGFYHRLLRLERLDLAESRYFGQYEFRVKKCEKNGSDIR